MDFIVDSIHKGGPFMWPILLMALVGLAVIIERWRSLKMLGGDNTELKKSVLNDLAANRIEAALIRCEQAAGPVAAEGTTGQSAAPNLRARALALLRGLRGRGGD